MKHLDILFNIIYYHVRELAMLSQLIVLIMLTIIRYHVYLIKSSN